MSESEKEHKEHRVKVKKNNLEYLYNRLSRAVGSFEVMRAQAYTLWHAQVVSAPLEHKLHNAQHLTEEYEAKMAPRLLDRAKAKVRTIKLNRPELTAERAARLDSELETAQSLINGGKHKEAIDACLGVIIEVNHSLSRLRKRGVKLTK